MKHFLALALVATTVSGCAARYTPQLMAVDSRACQASGFRSGTSSYDYCMASKLAARAERVRQNDQAVAAAIGVAVVGGAAVAAGNGGYIPAAPPRYTGNCQYAWQYDAAGRRCGRRAAEYRPGGY